MELHGVKVVGPFHISTDPTHTDFVWDPQKLQRMHEVAPFFTEDRLRVVVSFLDENDPDISLRDLDHVVTHMAPVTPMSWEHDGAVVSLHCVYRTWLSTWKRRMFDCFRRFERVYFRVDGQWYGTTPAQLNFFYFAFGNGLLTYARSVSDTIHTHRRAWARARKASTTDKEPLCEQTFQVVSIPCVVKF